MRKYETDLSPKGAFDQGFRFLVSDEALRRTAAKKEHVKETLVIPAMVMSAFAAELFLKSLLALEGTSGKGIHHLAALFDKLSKERRADLELRWTATVQLRERELAANERTLGIQIPRDLPTSLQDCGDTFRLLRYVYEDAERPKFYIIDFAEIAYRAILDLQPDWKPSIAV